ncbi:hypothetical protein F4804DRAFT_243098 [Jackrogersella minutella]|nr:hypothetical protein F4804DRAFT_243098 [Jackrogersella minutella]
MEEQNAPGAPAQDLSEATTTRAMVRSGPNLATGHLPDKPTSDDLQRLISGLGRLNGLAGLHGSGVLARDLIRYLFKHIQDRPSSDHTFLLQYNFTLAVARAVLNRNTPIGSERLQPRVGQVQSIQRVVFRHGDTILVAWTGYGKTIVLQTVSIVLQDQVIIQLCPLKRLGQDQVDSIAQIPGARLLFIDGETNNKKLWLP